MERSEGIDRLPAAYAAALRLVDGGGSVAEIASVLGVAVEAVPLLVVIGEQKLAAILADAC